MHRTDAGPRRIHQEYRHAVRTRHTQKNPRFVGEMAVPVLDDPQRSARGPVGPAVDMEGNAVDLARVGREA